jgi:TonB-linked SusC/RagA family outer membrane protein
MPLKHTQLMRKFLTFLFAVLLSTALYAQKVVQGKIVDAQGAPISFATVAEAGANNSVQADANGNFSIRVKEGARLTVTATGYGARTLSASDNLESVALTRTEGQLQEVVVTALGIRRQAKELGYATSRVTSAELTQGRAVNLQQGLTGKVSGLNIITTNSGVFENTRINLRGIRSLTGNNQPLLVIDGIPTPIEYMSSINPNDVQDVNVLKGASAASLYGPDGVNGVILVTTRRGTRGKPVVTVSNTTTLARVSFMPEMQNIFGSGSDEDVYGNGIYDPVENQQYGSRFNGQLIAIGPVLEDGDQQMVTYSPLKNEKKKFWNNGLTIQNDVSFSTQDFYLSVQDARIKGLMPNDENRRTSFRFNAAKEYNRFRAGFNLNFIQQNYDVVNESLFTGRFANTYNGSIYFAILNTPAHIPLTSYKDWRNNKYAQYSNYFNDFGNNPYWIIDNHRREGRENTLLGSFDLNYKIAPWLAATFRLGSNFTFETLKDKTAPIVLSDYANSHRSGSRFDLHPGAAADGSFFNSRVNGELFLNGKREIADFGVSYLLGTQLRQNDIKNVSVSGSNLFVPNLYNISNRSGNPGAAESNFRSRLGSVYGSLGVSYKGWANIEFSGRNDWDSRLNIGSNSYFYPGVNASFVLSEAIPMLANSSLISYAKVRGSVSRSGNVNLGTTNNLGAYQLAATFSQAGGFPYNSLGGFTANNTKPDDNIQPEFVNAKEIGFEIGFLKNRINVDATYFHQNNTNQILTVNQSSFTGYPFRVANTADFINYGFEADLRLTPLVNIGSGRINLNLNATYNNNEIKSLFEGINELSIGGSANFTQSGSSSPSVSNFAIVGQPAYVFKLTDYKRDPLGRVIVDPITGNPAVSDSLVTRGRSLPVWLFGVNPSYSWKGLSIGMTWDYKGGHYAYTQLGTDMDFTGTSARSAMYDRQRFVFPNSVYWDGSKYVENIDRQVQTGGKNFFTNASTNSSIGTNYFFSASSWKLRELAISYDLPTNWIGNGKILQKATISLVGRNLLTFVPKTNQYTDPEFNYTSTGNTLGLSSTFQTPPSRTFGGSVILTF